MLAQRAHFANCVLQNTEPATPGEEGLNDLLAVEEVYKAAGSSVA
jgi:predicted dehydrogenase